VTQAQQSVDVSTRLNTQGDDVTSLPRQSVDVSTGVNTQGDDVTSLPQQSVDVSSDVSTQSDDVTSEARTLEVDPSQPVACSLQLPSVIRSDVGAHVNDVRTDCQHFQGDEADTRLDETLYHDCISTSFTSKLLFFSTGVELCIFILPLLL